MFNSPKPDLDSMLGSTTARYPSDNAYCPNNWTPAPPAYNNNYYNTTYNHQQQYGNYPPPTMVVYPSILSQVNQSQIHFHLHATPGSGTDKTTDQQYLKNEPYLDPTSTINPVVHRVEGPSAPSEVHTHAEVDPLTIDDSERTVQSQNDPSSVWRPY
ncbi:unnamed protein product [Acanthoscelides obtectus]|uniref:Uncharacterized protein n=1 Tax=Acanthoscelides obtectus TaxID=200917 RepID=A0A9P0P3Q0_ACAOB|nr:unnamed protein product [Acanthoscelides obtectus]CAK1666610.1 hypothetical protein AOBTE_LOCUS25394 [Acanthoscelides obtectus]